MTKTTVKKVAAKKAKSSAKTAKVIKDDLEKEFLDDEALSAWLHSKDKLNLKLKGTLSLEDEGEEYAQEELDEKELEQEIEEAEEFSEDGFDEDDFESAAKLEGRKSSRRKNDLFVETAQSDEHEEGAENGYRQLVRFGRSRGWVTIAEINGNDGGRSFVEDRHHQISDELARCLIDVGCYGQTVVQITGHLTDIQPFIIDSTMFDVQCRDIDGDAVVDRRNDGPFIPLCQVGTIGIASV